MYYGDKSSLIPLYQCHEKPVMLQNINAAQKDFYGIAKMGFLYGTRDVLWATAQNFRALIKIDKKTWEAEYVGHFPNEKPPTAGISKQYNDIIECGNVLYFSPQSAEKIALFDHEHNSFSEIEIPTPKKNETLKAEYRVRNKFRKVLKADGKLFFTPGMYPGILVYDPIERSVKLIDSWLSNVDTLIFDNNAGYFLNGIVDEKRGSLALACANANAVLELDIVTFETVVHKLGDEQNGYMDIILVDNRYWLLSLQKASIVCWDFDNGECKEYVIRLEGIAANEPAQFQKLVHVGDSLFLIPNLSEKIIKFDLNDHTFSFAQGFSPQKQTPNDLNYHFLRFINTGSTIYLQPNNQNPGEIIEYDPTTGHLQERCICFKNSGPYTKRAQSFVSNTISEFKDANDCILRERVRVETIESMLGVIAETNLPEWLVNRVQKQSELLRGEIAHGDGKAGEEILAICKKEVLD